MPFPKVRSSGVRGAKAVARERGARATDAEAVIAMAAYHTKSGEVEGMESSRALEVCWRAAIDAVDAYRMKRQRFAIEAAEKVRNRAYVPPEGI